MCLIRSMFLEEEFVQICTILKMSQKVFPCVGAINVITCQRCCDIGHLDHALILHAYGMTSPYAETF